MRWMREGGRESLKEGTHESVDEEEQCSAHTHRALKKEQWGESMKKSDRIPP